MRYFFSGEDVVEQSGGGVTITARAKSRADKLASVLNIPKENLTAFGASIAVYIAPDMQVSVNAKVVGAAAKRNGSAIHVLDGVTREVTVGKKAGTHVVVPLLTIRFTPGKISGTINVRD